jgi:hypothetical protein
MTRWVRLLVVGTAALVVAAMSATATAAPAASSVEVNIKLVELLKAPPYTFPTCPDIGEDVNCGSGEFRPFGQASEIVSINACGDICTIRWITVRGGTIVLREALSDPSCPGACVTQWPHGAPFSGTLTADVVYGTGIFAGATGSLTGTLTAAAFEAQITYSGTIALE